jgi:glycosyltransferase involved in cell wall biosynthesis
LQVVSATHRRGAEISAVDLRQTLQRRAWDLELVALRRSPGPETLDIPFLGERRFSGLPRLRSRIRASRGVLAHGSDTLPATVLAGAGTAVPFVYRAIGDPRYWSGRADRRLRVRLELRHAAAVVATFHGAADALMTHYGVPAHRVHVIANGRPLARFPEATLDERRAARRTLLPGVEGAVVALLGSLSPEKAPERAVRAVAQLPDTHLLVVGDGPLADLVAEYGAVVAPGRVHLVGAHRDPRPALLAADALVLTSRSEGFPGALVEAGLCGLPVVATDVGAVRDAVVPGETGFIVDCPDGEDRPARLADAIADALVDALRARDRLGASARRHAERHFDLEVLADQWEAVLGEVFA